MGPQDVPQRSTHELGIVGVERRDSLVLDDESAVEKRADVVGRDPEIPCQQERFAVRHLPDIAKPEPDEVVPNHPE